MRERERKIHFILDIIYLFRARFGVYPLNRRCMGRGMIGREMSSIGICALWREGKEYDREKSLLVIENVFWWWINLDFFLFYRVSTLLYTILVKSLLTCWSCFFFSLGFLWARLLSMSFVCQIYCYRFYFQRLFPIVVYCLFSLFGELTICCEMQTKLDPSYPSSICGSTPYGYPTIATQLPVPGSSVAPVNAQREIRNSQLCIVPIWGQISPKGCTDVITWQTHWIPRLV